MPRAGDAPLGLVENMGVAMIADGEAEVLRRVREQLMLGAVQIKMLAGGGVACLYDPLRTRIARRRGGRRRLEHLCDDVCVQRAMRAGVKCIEHGQLADEASVRMMRDERVLGRIVKAAWAALLIADGDPAANLDFLADPEKNLHLILKDGKIHKNRLQQRRAGSLPAPLKRSGVVFAASNSGV